MAGSAVSAASSGGDAVAHLPRTSLNKDSSGSAALSRSSAGSAHGVKTFVDKVRPATALCQGLSSCRQFVPRPSKRSRA